MAPPQDTTPPSTTPDYAAELGDDRQLRRPRGVTTTSKDDLEGFRSRDHIVAVLMQQLADKEIIAPTSLLPMLEASLAGVTVVTDTKRAHLREQVRKITDIFPSQDEPLPRADIHAALCLYAGQSPSILQEYDIRLIVTELLQEMQAPNYQPPTEDQADEERSRAEADLAQAQRGLAYLQLEQPTREAYDQAVTTKAPEAKAPAPVYQAAPPAESWSAARGRVEATQASIPHKPSSVPTDKDLNIWTGTSSDAAGRAGYRRSDSAHAPARRGGPPTRGRKAGPNLDHLLHILPDAATAPDRQQQQITAPITASTTGPHHPSQPQVWAQDAIAGGHHHHQQPATRHSASSSSGDATDEPRRWPSFEEACAANRQ